MKTTRTLAIATAMALALIAIAGASSASANWFKSHAEPTSWNGSLLGKSHVLNLGGETFHCQKVNFSSSATNPKVSELTASPELGTCTWVNNLVVGWSVNGCKYRFHAGSDEALTGWMDITGCEEPMRFTAGGCTIEIGNQSTLGTVTYKNVAGSPSTVTAVASLSGITYTRGGPCGEGSPGTFSNGTYTGEWTVEGTTGGIPVGVEVKATAAPYSHVYVEETPATIAGMNDSSLKRLHLPGAGDLTCGHMSLSGSLGTNSATALTLTPKYSTCKFGGESIPDSAVSSGGCSYVYHVSGAVDIAGATCASEPITISKVGCTDTIGPQTGLAANLEFTNEGWGPFRLVSMHAATNSTGLSYTASGPSCTAGEGSFNDGTFMTGSSKSLLGATNSGGVSQGIWIE